MAPQLRKKRAGQSAPFDPGAGEPFVLGRDDKRAPLGELAIDEQGLRGCGHDADRVELRVEQRHETIGPRVFRGDTELGHPVGASETQVAGPGVQHAHDVLGLEDLGVDVVERHGRPIAAFVDPDLDASVTQELEHAWLHAAFGQCELEDVRAVLDHGRSFGSGLTRCG